MKEKWILLVALICIFPSCGKLEEKFSRLPSGYTRVSFKAGQGGPLNTTATLTGKVMVYLERTDGSYARSLALQNETENRDVTVPSGLYRVYAIGWNGANGAISTAHKCGAAFGGAPIPFNGISVTVPITLTDAGCAVGSDSFFAKSNDVNNNSPPTGYRRVVAYFCPSAPNNGCSGANLDSKGGRFLLHEYERKGSQLRIDYEKSLKGPCTAFLSTLNVLSLNAVPPTTQPAGLEVYSDTACTATLERSYDFFHGTDRAEADYGSSFLTISRLSGNTFRLNIHKDF